MQTIDPSLTEEQKFLIECRHISLYRGDRRVLNDFSLDIKSGEHTVILGPNGAGKSTFLRMISRDLYPAYNPESVFRLFGHDRWNLWDLRARAGILSMELQEDIPGHLSGRDLVMSGYQGVMDVRAFREFTESEWLHAEELMETLGIGHLANREFAMMSSGEARRVLLGRALVNKPELLIFDEPTANLDPYLMFQYLKILRQLMQERLTVLLVTHHIHEIPPEINRVILLKNGRIMAEGSKKEVLTSKNMTELFETELDIASHNGYFTLYPKM